MTAYAVAVAATALQAARHGARRDAAGLLVVLPVMHASWGAGFLAGTGRHGCSAAAIRALVRPNRR